MNNKHIAILADDFPSEGRPVFVFVEQLVVALVDLGVKVSVIAPQSLTRAFIRRIGIQPLSSIIRTARGNYYNVYRPYCISFGNGHRTLYKFVDKFNQNRITKVLHKIIPDILYGHFWHNALKLNTFSKTHKLPLFVACGEGDDALENLAKSMPVAVLKEFTNNISGVICVSTDNKNRCLKYKLCDNSKMIVLPNAVDDTLFYPYNSEKKRKELGIEEDDFVVVFSGAFIHRKGADRLGKAINKIKNTHLKSIFIGKPLIGDAALPDCEGIVFQGELEHNEIPDYLNCANIFVLPTLKEGCSNAIVEALACGLPIISSNRAFNYDILNEYNSILIDPNSVDEIASAIQKIMSNPDYYKEKRRYAIVHAGDFSITERANKVFQFISNQIS